ncbi:CRISPR/Cas system-associated protein Cas5 (RAMP superfamily) [Curtobacterium pusillum]|uniref:CRISPR/Cas system-associated protein Cas5 (RAMP superfamily) n=1 Tax=Curtobacterium pusillum TaxID=69373 RepID=A0AAW3T5G9_9MICO|nr:CRISPR/Cas system-associated protein Cas5 (RAMP superfamily) [Curtobacterium pusillum]
MTIGSVSPSPSTAFGGIAGGIVGSGVGEEIGEAAKGLWDKITG